MDMTPARDMPALHTGERLGIFALATVAAVIVAHAASASLPVAVLSLAAVAVAIWHGAFDGVLAQGALAERWGVHWQLIFLSGYLALAAAVLVLWWAAPFVALGAFLLYSAFHFGTEGDRQLSPIRGLGGLAAGFVPIAASCHWWPAAVTPIFAAMLRAQANHAAMMTGIAGAWLWPAVALSLLGTLGRPGRAGLETSALLLTELALFRLCSPLSAFALFFCLWHTPEHMVSTSLDAAGRFRSRVLWRHLRAGTGPWLLSLAAMATVCWFGRHSFPSYAGTLFIGLSALTVPHMVLAEICRRHEAHALQTKSRIFSSHSVVIHS